MGKTHKPKRGKHVQLSEFGDGEGDVERGGNDEPSLAADKLPHWLTPQRSDLGMRLMVLLCAFLFAFSAGLLAYVFVGPNLLVVYKETGPFCEGTGLTAASQPCGWCPQASNGACTPFVEKIQDANLQGHLNNLYKIAGQHNGSRTESLGFNATVDYITESLRANSDLTVSTQLFPFELFEVISGPNLYLVEAEGESEVDDVKILSYSGSGNVTAKLSHMDFFGCRAVDWTGMTPGNVALVSRGNCTFQEKADLADAYGAVGMVLYNEGDTKERMGAFSGTLGDPVSLPVVGTTFSNGKILIKEASEGGIVHLFVDVAVRTVNSKNVIADTKGGRADRVIVVGAHMDSVAAGSGMSDNASGVSGVLELARNYLGSVDPVNKIRFCFWGGEEHGLKGSKHYVSHLNATEGLSSLSLNLNFDMIGSPNGFRGIYDGASGPADVRNGSQSIQNVFNGYFLKRGLESAATPFNGRSDYGPFIEAGVPAGGLETGAEGIKSAEYRAKFGGLANAAFDPCYHQACDTIENVNHELHLEMARGAAYAVEVLSSAADLSLLLGS